MRDIKRLRAAAYLSVYDYDKWNKCQRHRFDHAQISVHTRVPCIMTLVSHPTSVLHGKAVPTDLRLRIKLALQLLRDSILSDLCTRRVRPHLFSQSAMVRATC